MFSVRTLSIRHKLPLFFMITSGAALLVASVSFVAYDMFAFRRTMADNLSVLAEGVGINSTAALTFDVRGSGEEILAALRAYPNIVAACTFDRRGELFSSYSRSGGPAQCPPAPPARALSAFESTRLIHYQPVVHDGEVLGTVFLESDLAALSQRLQRYAVTVALVTLGALLVAYVLSSRLQRSISGPILRLAKLETRVWKEEDYSLRAERETDDEMGVLIDGFNEMLSQIQARDVALRRNFGQLQEMQDRLAGELSDAATYVRTLLPPPVTGDISVDWRFLPSTHLGGDSFGYHWLDDDHMAIYLLDVCGHGVRAALLSVSVSHVLRSQSLPDTDFLSPAAVLYSLNNAFHTDARRDRYFSIWYGVYDRTTRELVYASGGHPPAVLFNGRIEEKQTLLLRTAGFVVGGIPNITYEQARQQIASPATLFVFSDGLYEVPQADGTMLGLELFTGFLRRTVENDRRQRLDHVIRAIQQVGGSAGFEDDCSVVKVTFA
jgi:serine phosphatase RsbU (regulator of sigma subunit)